MSKALSPSEELRRWKDKYFELQENFDAQEKDAEAFRSVLQRMLLRVCLSAEGQSAQFDQALSDVRADVRAPSTTIDDFVARLAELEAALAKIDTLKTNHSERYQDLIASMGRQLDALKPPRNDRNALKKLSKLLRKESLLVEQYVPVLEEFAQTQESVLTWMAQQAPEKPGFMAKLFGQNKAGDGVSMAVSDDADAEADPALELDASDSLDEDEVVPGFAAISVHVRNTLNHLLDQLTLPESSQRAANELREKISGPLNWYELGPTLDDLSNIVISAVGRGQRDFGSFLSDIDGRLQKIQSAVFGALQADEAYFAESEKMDAQVRSRISTMTESLATESNVDDLKSSIKSQVDSISSVLDQFSELSRAALETKLKDYELLKSRFEELEQESKHIRERLKEERSKALTDALTGLPNREAYDERLMMEYERWKRYGNPMTMVVADVDHFKSINDNYGHLSGDKVLQILAKELQARLRKTDFIARFGGEEFVFLLPETDLETARSVMDKSRELISRLPFHFRDQKVAVTVSFGMVGFTEGHTPEALFEMADQALYRAKENGRNRIEVAQV